MVKFDPRWPSPYAQIPARIAVRQMAVAMAPAVQDAVVSAAAAGGAAVAWVPTLQQLLGAFSAYKAAEVVTEGASTAKQAVSATIEIGTLHVEETMEVAASEFQRFIRDVHSGVRLLCSVGVIWLVGKAFRGVLRRGLSALVRKARKFVWPSPFAQPAGRSHDAAEGSVPRVSRAGPKAKARYAAWSRVAKIQSRYEPAPAPAQVVLGSHALPKECAAARPAGAGGDALPAACIPDGLTSDGTASAPGGSELVPPPPIADAETLRWGLGAQPEEGSPAHEF